MPLEQSDINRVLNVGNLEDKIRNYEYDMLDIYSEGTLIRLKAMDTVKDGASAQLAMEIFQPAAGIFIQSNCKDLPSSIKNHFDRKVEMKQLKLLEYTRIKSRGDADVIMEGFNCDVMIPDCGPLYGPGNNKTPVIKKVDRDNPAVKYSLGNIMDSGPSSNNTISAEFGGTYIIPQGIMRLLGYPNCSISVEKNIPIIYIDGEKVAENMIEFKSAAQGNQSKGVELAKESTGLPRKKQLLYFKSLGDGLIVFFWYVYCLKYPQTCALLTCDSVVALQADIFSQGVNNAYFAWNCTEKGEKHISRVYAKCGEPKWQDLCIDEYNQLNTEYTKVISICDDVIKNRIIEVEIGDGRYISKNVCLIFFTFLKQKVDTVKAEFRKKYSINQKNKDLFDTLKSYALNSPIKKIEGNKIILKYPHTKLYSNGPPCYEINGKNCNLHAKIRNIQLENNDTEPLLTHKIEGGRNPFDKSEADEEFLSYSEDSEKGSYDKAINILKNFILNVLEKLIEEMIPDSEINPVMSNSFGTDPLYVVPRGKSEAEKQKYVNDALKYIITSDENFLYEYLTYEFHANPDYSSERIIELCSEVINITIESYNIISDIREKARIRRMEELGPSFFSQEPTQTEESTISPVKISKKEKEKKEGGRKTRRIHKKITLKHKKRLSPRKTRRSNIIK